MKVLIKSNTEVRASEEPKKLKRTLESGHSYDKPIIFGNTDEMMK